jgi:hypothetical protein
MEPNYILPFSGLEKGAQLFCRALWTVKVNFLVKTLGAMELIYIHVTKNRPQGSSIVDTRYKYKVVSWRWGTSKDRQEPDSPTLKFCCLSL